MARDMEQLYIASSMTSIRLQVVLVIIKGLVVMRLQLSTDFESVILVSPTLTYYQVTINQLTALLDIHLQSSVYYWTVLIYKVSDEDTSLYLSQRFV